MTTPSESRCPVCAEGTLEARLAARGLAPDDPPFQLARCAVCGFGRNLPLVPESEIGRWYPPAYYGKENVRFNPVFEWLVRLFRKRRAGVIERRARRGAVLDVGCGRGFMLGFLGSRGFEPHGVELTEAGAWHARNRLGIPVHVGGLLDAPYPPERFEAIIFWHSLEHMLDPESVLRRAKALLKPGGLLVVAVPNSDSLQARWFGASWFHLDIPRHYCHFGSRSLRRQLEKLGFRVVQQDHLSLEQNPYGWLQSFFNAMGFDFNFLYSLVKAKSARMHSIRQHPVQTLLTALLLPVLLPLSGVLTLVEAALGKGGTIEVYAIRDQSASRNPGSA